MKVVCLLSGGLDSTTLLAKLVAEGHQVRCLSVLYGQRHSREWFAARSIVHRYQVEHETVKLPTELLSGSALTGKGEVPDGHYADPSMRTTVVPARNLVLLSLATAVAVRTKANAVAYAAHSGDHAVYPDCRPQFVSAMEDVMARADYEPIQLLTPFVGRSKSGIVSDGAALEVPFYLTYSCYKGSERHCGRCGTCVERREAFQLAGVPDPTDYGGDG